MDLGYGRLSAGIFLRLSAFYPLYYIFLQVKQHFKISFALETLKHQTEATVYMYSAHET